MTFMTHTVEITEVAGDILAIRSDAIVNPWNRNFIPRWMWRSGGISGALQRLTGPDPWVDLARMGMLDLGQAVSTSTGDFALAHEIIHVAGLTKRWKATQASVFASAQNAAILARSHDLATITMPLIGSGHGGLSAQTSRETIKDALAQLPPDDKALHVLLVDYQSSPKAAVGSRSR